MTTIQLNTPEQRLAELAERVRADLAMLAFATKPWVIPRQHDGAKIPDVVIIGGGQSGLVAGHALKLRVIRTSQRHAEVFHERP